MKIFQVVGQPGSGKTTLAAQMIHELTRQGMSVGSIKHSSHAHELDKKGKDSFLHRKAGASPVTMMTRDMAAVYLPRTNDMTPETMLKRYYAHLDVVIIEGWISGPYPKIEVIRPEISTVPLFTDIKNVVSIVCDKNLPKPLKEKATSRGLAILPGNDIKALATAVLKLLS